MRILHTLTVVSFVFLASATAWAQDPDPKHPPVRADQIRNLYVIGKSPVRFTAGGSTRMGFPVYLQTQVKGHAEIILNMDRAGRWFDVDGRRHVLLGSDSKEAYLTESTLEMTQADSGDYAGWYFLVPPFRSVLVRVEPRPTPTPTPPKTKPDAPQAQPTPAPPSGNPIIVVPPNNNPVVIPAIYFPKQRQR